MYRPRSRYGLINGAKTAPNKPKAKAGSRVRRPGVFPESGGHTLSK